MNGNRLHLSKIIVAGDLTLSNGQLISAFGDMILASGTLTLDSKMHIDKLDVIGGTIKLQSGEELSVGDISELVIKGNVSIEGDALLDDCGIARGIPLCDRLTVEHGDVTMKGVIIHSAIIKGGTINMENTHLRSGVGDSLMIQKGGTINVRKGSSFHTLGGEMIDPKKGIIQVNSGDLNIENGYFLRDKANETSTANGDYSIIRLAGDDAKVTITDGFFSERSICGIYMEKGELTIHGGYIEAPICTAGGNLNITGGILGDGGREAILIARPTNIVLSGGRFKGNYPIEIGNGVSITPSSILASGHSFYTKEPGIQPDILLNAGEVSQSVTISGVKKNVLKFGEVRQTANSPKSDLYKAAVSADIGPDGNDVKIVGTDYLIKTTAGLAWVAVINNYSQHQISNGQQYIPIAKSVNYCLANDLDLSQYNWLPINGLVNSSFDGRGHRISNLTVRQNNPAFISYLGINNTLSNLIIEGTIIHEDTEYLLNEDSQAAGLVINNRGTIVNCAFRGSITSSLRNGGQIGGLVANNSGAIYNSYMVGAIHVSKTGTTADPDVFACRATPSHYYIGGLACYNRATIRNCYHIGAVNFTNTSGEIAGFDKNGLVGYTFEGAIIPNCYDGENANLANLLNANVIAYNKANPNAGTKWRNWGLNNGYPIHDNPSITLSKEKGVGTLSASYKVGEKDEIIKADTTVSLSNTDLTIKAMPAKHYILQKITIQLAGGEEENYTGVKIKPTGVTFEYKQEESIVTFRAYFKYVSPAISLLKAKGDGTLSARYKVGEEDIIATADTTLLLLNVNLTIKATPAKNFVLEKITFQPASGEEEDYTEVEILPEGVTFEYMQGETSATFRTYFKVAENVVIEDGTSTIGDRESPASISTLKIGKENATATITLNDIKVENGAATTTVAPKATATILLSGETVLGTFVNEGTVTLKVKEGAKAELDNTTVTNNSIFTDETGFLDRVDGPADLKIGDRPSAINTLSGNTVTLTVSAESDAGTPEFVWEKWDGTTWKAIDKPSTPETKRSTLRAATTVENEISVGVGQYRCRITTTVGQVSSTLMTYATVRSATAPDPEPVYYTVTLPVLTGAVTTPAAGNHPVEELADFLFTLTLDADYNQSTPVVKANDQVITRDASGKYTVKNITADVTISISGIVKNAIVGNADIDPRETKVWSANGLLYLSTEQSMRVDIFTFDGKLYKQFQSMGGEQSVGLPSGIYIIRIQDKSFKVSL